MTTAVELLDAWTVDGIRGVQCWETETSDWDSWKVEEYAPKCMACGVENEPHRWESLDDFCTLAVCPKCGQAALV